MRRYRNDIDDERDYYQRSEYDRERFRRDEPWNFNDPYSDRSRSSAERSFGYSDYGRGRFGERAEYEYDEPRYGGYGYRGESEYRSPYDRGREYDRGYGEERRGRSRLRCRDIMTTDVAVATRDTTLQEVAVMMKREDTGVIPVVDYDLEEGNGRSRRPESGKANLGNGKLVGLITDRDIVVRALAEGKDSNLTRAEEIMTTDIYTARPNDRVVDVIRKMGDKQVRRIPVVSENGYLRGIISMADIAVETEEDLELAHAIEEISRSSSFWRRIFG